MYRLYYSTVGSYSIASLSLLSHNMSAVALPNGAANGHLPAANGTTTAAPKIKSSSAKSRGALKRLKAKQKGKSSNASASESQSEAGTDVEPDSDVEVCCDWSIALSD